MGLRGAQPKPAGIRRLEGNLSRRPIPEEAPYVPGIPDKPENLSPRGSAIWDELVEQIAASGVFCISDQHALAMLAEDQALLNEAYVGIWSIMAALEKQAKTEGKVLHGGPFLTFIGTMNGRRAMTGLNDLAARLLVERREFGLTPSARTRIKAGDAGIGPIALDSIERKLCG